MEYKYQLHYLLRQLPQDDYELTMRELPRLCQVTRRTLEHWIYRKSDDPAEIPLSAAVAIANWFQIPVIQLYTVFPKQEIQNF